MKLKHVPKHVPKLFWKTLRLEHFKTLPRPLKIDIATLKPWKISEKAIELRVLVEAFSSLQDPIAFGLLDQPVLAVPGQLNAVDMFFFQKKLHFECFVAGLNACPLLPCFLSHGLQLRPRCWWRWRLRLR